MTGVTIAYRKGLRDKKLKVLSTHQYFGQEEREL